MAKEKAGQRDLDCAVEGLSGNRVSCSMSSIIKTGDFTNITVGLGISKVVPDFGSFGEVKENVRVEVMTDLGDMVAIVKEAIKE